MTDWEGVTDRRAAGRYDERTRSRETVQVPIVTLAVGFAAMVLLQLGALVQHGFLAHDHNGGEEFRRQITCLVVQQSQGKTGPDLLTQCGFLKLGR